MGNIEIISSGPLTTIQDGGRYGYRSIGFSCSGAVDAEAAAAANLLAGNSADSALLEMTLTGVTASFDFDCVIAITGADMLPELNGVPIENYRAVAVGAGDVLKLGFAASGCRGYIAVNGALDVPAVMGSRSTALKYGVGGFCGRKLRAGDVIGVSSVHAVREPDKRRVEPPVQRSFVYAVYGPQDDMFTAEAKRAFESCEYTLTPDSDRMGARLSGDKLETLNGSDIISDGIVPGSVQVPKSGMPIILLSDCQTTGGYAKIATVCSFSLPVAAQKKPGERLRFKLITVNEAQTRKIAYQKYWAKLAKELRV